MASEEPTEAAVEAAVRSLPVEYLTELAKGPLETDDPDDCRICLLFDDWVFSAGHGPHTDAILILIDWHRWWGSLTRDGLGPESYRRCQVIYAFARDVLAAYPAGAA